MRTERWWSRPVCMSPRSSSSSTKSTMGVRRFRPHCHVVPLQINFAVCSCVLYSMEVFILHASGHNNGWRDCLAIIMILGLATIDLSSGISSFMCKKTVTYIHRLQQIMVFHTYFSPALSHMVFTARTRPVASWGNYAFLGSWACLTSTRQHGRYSTANIPVLARVYWIPSDETARP